MLDLTPQEWISDIKLGLRQRSANERELRWERNYRWFKGQYDKGLIPVNIVFGIIRALIPQVYFKAPKIMVRPRPGSPQEYPRRIAASKILEATDTYLITQMGLKKTLKLATLDALLYNVGIIKIGYHSVFSEFEVGPPAETQEVMQALSQITGEAPAPPDEMTDAERKKYFSYSYHDLIKPDQPWALRVSPKDFVIPVGCRNIEESPWCAFRFVKRLDEVKKSPVYKNKKDLRENATLKIDGSTIESPSEFRMSIGPVDDKYVELWEIWDKRDGTIRVVADGHDKYLRDEEHGLEMTGLPVEIIQFNSDGDDFWGISHVDAIAPQVLEYIETRTQEMWHRKINNLKLILNRQAFKPEEVAKLERGEIGPIVFTELDDPSKGIFQHKIDMSRDIFKVAEDIFSDLKVIIGYNRNQGGEFEQSRRTAEEIKTVQSNNQLRDDELRDIIADSLASLFQNKIHPLLFQNWTQERFVEVSSIQAQIPWIPFTASQIRGQYDVTVVPDSTLPLNKRQEKEEAAAIFQMFRGDAFIRQDALRRMVMERFDTIDPDTMLKTPQEMQQEQQQQFQMELAMAQAKTQIAGTQQQQKPQELVGGKGNGSAQAS